MTNNDYVMTDFTSRSQIGELKLLMSYQVKSIRQIGVCHYCRRTSFAIQLCACFARNIEGNSKDWNVGKLDCKLWILNVTEVYSWK